MAIGKKRDRESVPEEPIDPSHSERLGNHPTPEELSAYQANEMSPEESDTIQEHLAGCSLCTRALLDLQRFLDLPPEDRPQEGITDFETAAEWRVLRAKLEEEQLLMRSGARRPARRIALAMAAVLLVAVGFSFYVLSRSAKNFKTLEPLGSNRGRHGDIETVQLPVTLLLKSPAKTSYPEYRVDLWSVAGLHIRQLSRLKQSPSFDVEIPLKENDLAPGDYRIDLQGITNGTLLPVGKYVFRVIDG
jgi:hypothetical protein